MKYVCIYFYLNILFPSSDKWSTCKDSGKRFREEISMALALRMTLNQREAQAFLPFFTFLWAEFFNIPLLSPMLGFFGTMISFRLEPILTPLSSLHI